VLEGDQLGVRPGSGMLFLGRMGGKQHLPFFSAYLRAPFRGLMLPSKAGITSGEGTRHGCLPLLVHYSLFTTHRCCAGGGKQHLPFFSAYLLTPLVG
jgi:hypothetical protein